MGCGASRKQSAAPVQQVQCEGEVITSLEELQLKAAALLDRCGAPPVKPPPTAAPSTGLVRQDTRLFGKSIAPIAPEFADIPFSLLDALATRLGPQAVLMQVQRWESATRLAEVEKPAMDINEAATEPDHEDDDAGEAPDDYVTFVFTDIANSTALWEQATDEMDVALSLHNDVMRACSKANRGYEVKTIGDAFFLAFAEPIDAVRFMLSVQQELAQQEWPEGLGRAAAAQPVPHPQSADKWLYNGLRVRMGCHVGNVITEVNPLTGRADYRGPTVNTAARVEGQGKGGLIAITSDVLDAVKISLDELGNPELMLLGERKLKGVAEPVEIYMMAPADLKARLQDAKPAATTAQAAAPAPTTGFTSGLGKKLGMRLRRSHSTVGCSQVRRLTDPAESDCTLICDLCCDVVRSVEIAAADTEGILQEVLGDAFVTAWNTAKVCPCHVQQALRFAAVLQSNRHGKPDQGFGLGIPKGSGSEQLLTGICTGKVLFGSVGSLRRTFHVVVGFVPRIAAALAEHCATLQTTTLFADVANRGEKKGGIMAFLRTVDLWAVRMLSHPLVIEELNIGGVAVAEESFGIWDFLAEGQSAGMGGGETLTHGRSHDVHLKDQRSHTGDLEGPEVEEVRAVLCGDAAAAAGLRAYLQKGQKRDVTLEQVLALVACGSDPTVQGARCRPFPFP
eukprot:TRINITY_DN4783_c0_g2_i2.p1 TRINITY_DN4783_c0_g2~~TRINITY_DN4783_c0_g2_i2.p1  ORF type:complete len:706 (+),score=172.44 TRINITY_DN4783_c0_g2_i2:84-2120(+)